MWDGAVTVSHHNSDLPDEQEHEQIQYHNDLTDSPMIRYGGLIMLFLGFMQLIRAILYGTSGNVVLMIVFAVFSLAVFFLTLWYTGFFNHILENTDHDSLRHQADERANREGRAPSWHPDNL